MNTNPDNDTCLTIINEYLNGANGKRLAKELADLIGISEVTLSRWRNRKMAISAAYRKQIPFLCRDTPTARKINGSDQDINVLEAILAEIMDSDMCAECKVKAYSIITKHK